MHIIKVGFAGSSNFDPITTMVDINNVVVFEFYLTNYFIACGEYIESKACGSDFCNSCVLYKLIYLEELGFYSNDFITKKILNNLDVFL